MVEEDAIVDPDIFFTLPDTISLLQEQITIGNLPSLAQKTGLDQCEINALLRTITSKDGLKLMKIRMALGVQRERNSL
jgi:hypothetical protein